MYLIRLDTSSNIVRKKVVSARTCAFSYSVDTYLPLFLGYADTLFVPLFLKVFLQNLAKNPISLCCLLHINIDHVPSFWVLTQVLGMTVLVFIRFIITRKSLSRLCSIGGVIVIVIVSKTDVFMDTFVRRSIYWRFY